jgi:hypothetical protein
MPSFCNIPARNASFPKDETRQVINSHKDTFKRTCADAPPPEK